MSIVYRTYEDLMEEALAYGEERGVDIRQGSIYYDAVVGHCIRTAKFYEDLKIMADLVLLDTATGEQLDQLGKEHGMKRNEATYSKWKLICEGTEPDSNTRFFVDSLYFILSKGNNALYLTAEQAGSAANALIPGSNCVPVVNIQGLTSSILGELVSYGTDIEDDDSFRLRIREKVGRSAENGNKQHYKTWCEDVSGVGRAKIFPLWAGPNTVKGIIFDTGGKPALQTLVDAVQEYIDPITKNYTVTVDGVSYVVGDGLGEGVANLGAHFLAEPAKEKKISISFSASFIQGNTKESAEKEAIEVIEANFKKMALESSDTDNMVVRYTSIGAIISSLNSVLDYSSLLINGASENVIIDSDSVATLTEVTVNDGV